MSRRITIAAACAVVALAIAGLARAQQAAPVDGPAVPAATPPVQAQASAAPGGDAVSDYFAHWFDRVDAAKASQPQWMTPIVTVTPRLEEEFRYDQYWEKLGNGADLTNFDAGKGLELIPTTSNEVILNLPPYIDRTIKKPAEGFNDWPFLLVKQRIVSANEQNGNYIVTAFLGVQAPTGVKALTNDAWVVTPTLAAGKGWGDFDVQATIGVPIPLSHENIIGTSLVTNIAFQYHFATYFWPEVEVNSTYWFDGQRSGKNQVFITPGVVLGRFKIVSRVKGIVGVGYQIAVSPALVTTPVLTPTYQHAWVLTLRTTF
jgi:hypothetical protein